MTDARLDHRPGRWRATAPCAAGSAESLAAAIGRGADLRVYTEFLFEEHIVPGGDGDPAHDGLIREVIDFRETILVDGRHVGGDHDAAPAAPPAVRVQRHRPRMSFFLYTARRPTRRCANLLLRRRPSERPRPGERRWSRPPADMPKMSPEVVFDLGTTGPSRNFVYDMEIYRYFVRDDWEELLAHDADGQVTGGSFDALEAAQIAGREFKVGIRGLARGPRRWAPEHEVFSLVGSGFFHTRAAAVRRADPPARPRRAGDPAALPLLRLGCRVGPPADRRRGATVRRLDPYTRRFADTPARFACRWFAR